MKKEISDNARSVGLHSPAGNQNKRQVNIIDKEVISKILEGDPIGAANNIKICIRNENASKRKRVQEEPQSPEKHPKVDLKKPFYSSTPGPPQKRSSVDSDCCLGSSGSFDESPQHGEFSIRSQWECAERDFDLDDSLLEPSDNEQVDSPCRLTEDEITSLLDDNLVATGRPECAVELSLSEISYWHARNPAPETSESKLSLVRNTLLESGSESPGEWAERLLELSGCDAKEESASECKKELQLEGEVQCSQVVNMPFDIDIDELLALSPIDGSTMYNAGEGLVVDEEEPFVYEESEPLKKEHDHVNESSQCEITASSKLNIEKQDHLPVLVEKDLYPGQKVVKEASHKSEISNPTKTSAPSQKRKQNPLIASCIVVPQPSSNAQKLTSFLLQLNKSLDAKVSPIPVVTSSGSCASATVHSSGVPRSKNFGPKNAALFEMATSSTSNAKPDKEKKVVSSKDSATVLPPVKKLGKVVPIPKVENRQRTISPAELERKKQAYMQSVMKHIRSSEDPNQDAYDELLTLMDQVASVEYRNPEQNWQHPSDLTTRNYPRFAKKPPNKYSLSQWMSRNGGSHRRFHNLADRFQRSSVIAFSSL